MKAFEEFITEGINDLGTFKAIILAGNPGSGKSYTLDKIKIGSIDPRIVNTDKLTEYFGGVFSGKVKRITKNQLYLYLNSMLPLFVDGTASKPSAVFRRKGILESLGYDVGMLFVETSLETSVRRVKEREKFSPRKVPDDFIKKSYETVMELKHYYRSRFNEDFYVVKNDDNELTNKVLRVLVNEFGHWFSDPIENPIGQENKRIMLENGIKYLVPDIYKKDHITRICSVWYESD